MTNNLESLNLIILELTNLIPQFSSFIDQFNVIINANDVAVITDSTGNMSIDVPKHMSDDSANALTKRIGIVDRLINDRRATISDLFRKGFEIESNLKSENSKYVTQLSGKFTAYRALDISYKH